MTNFDTIVLGSDAGGLTSALCLARAGQRVLVLEAASKPGGWCQTIEVDRHRFTPGIPFAGELGPGGRLRQIYEGLGVARDLTFFELNPAGVDHLRGGTQRFDVPKGKEALAAALVDRFPHEASGIRAYLDLCEEVSELVGAVLDARNVWKLRRHLAGSPLPALAETTSHEALVGRFVSDPELVRLLCAQTGTCPTRPAVAPAALHAALAGHLFGGRYYPRGGGDAITSSFERALARAHAELRLNAPVARILVEERHGRARSIGVRLADGAEISAARVISTLDPSVTLGRLAGLEPWRGSSHPASEVAVTLMAVVELDLERLGFDSGSLCFEAGAASGLPRLRVSAPNLKDPLARRHGAHALEAVTLLPASAEDGVGADSKPRLRARMIEALSAVLPGFGESLVSAEIDLQPVPATGGAPFAHGALPGERSPWQVEPWGWGTRTPIEGLLLCGTSTGGPSLYGATLSGVEVACEVLRCCPEHLLTEEEELTVLPSDAPEDWAIGY